MKSFEKDIIDNVFIFVFAVCSFDGIIIEGQA